MLTNDCKVKLCGTSSVEDARLAEEHGADYVGALVGVDFSERNQTVEEARAIFASTFASGVVLTFNLPPKAAAETLHTVGADAIQLLGQETPDDVADLKEMIDAEAWKSVFLPPSDAGAYVDLDAILVRLREYAAAGVDKLLLDTAAFVGGKHRFGGTGKTSDWELCRELIAAAPVPTFLSGGVRPENVAEACQVARPFGVDLCSGVESSRGRRDPDKTAALMRAVRKVARP